MILHTKWWILTAAILGTICYVTIPSLSKNSKDIFKLIREKKRHHVDILEYWNQSERSKIRFKSHANRIKDLKNATKYEMVEIDITPTFSRRDLTYVLLKQPGENEGSVYPKFDFWYKRFKSLKNGRKLPGLKINMHSSMGRIVKALKRVGIERLEIPLWFCVEGVPGSSTTLEMQSELLRSIEEFSFVPTYCVSLHSPVHPWEKVNFNFYHNFYYFHVKYAIQGSRMEHVVITARAELLRNSWRSFKANLLEETPQLSEAAKLKSLHFYIHGKTDMKFYRVLVEAAANYSFFFNLEIVPYEEIYPGDAKNVTKKNLKELDYRDIVEAETKLKYSFHHNFYTPKNPFSFLERALMYTCLVLISLCCYFYSIVLSSDIKMFRKR